MVPPGVAEIIKKRKLLGYPDKPRPRRGGKNSGGLTGSVHLAGVTKGA